MSRQPPRIRSLRHPSSVTDEHPDIDTLNDRAAAEAALANYTRLLAHRHPVRYSDHRHTPDTKRGTTWWCICGEVTR